jgi:Domain of unknown function (DUF4126)
MDAHNLTLAYSLSSVSGLRASLTILALTIAIHLHAVAPPSALAWVGSDQTLIVVAILAFLDFFADKIPVVDHVVHLVHAVLAPVAGGLAAATVDPSGGGVMPVVAILGGANALGIHGLRSTTRAGSSVTTAGVLNPILSIVEDLLAVAGLALAFVAPYVMAAVALIATLLFALLGRRIWRAMRPRSGTISG